MGLATVHTRAALGIAAPAVQVEVHTSGGLPGLCLVGLPETAVKESKDRVRAALQNADFHYPASRVTVNLAPADLPKEGGRYDLPIALGILAASGQIKQTALAEHEFLGELSLSGRLRPVRGILPAAIAVRDSGRTLVVAAANAPQAALARRINVLAAEHLSDVAAHLNASRVLTPTPAVAVRHDPVYTVDLADVRGQHRAKRALEIAAAGGHSLLMIGPPGSGKTLLANRLHTLLPPLQESQALEAAAIASISGHAIESENFFRRPTRAPHHSASSAALVGGGSNPRPGEISLAHEGILFLDELPEFNRKTLETLREPLESGEITISRAGRQARFPARFQLIAAMNPCPRGDDCTPEEERKYRNKLSEPLLDRIDMHVDVPRVPIADLRADGQEENSAAVRARVLAARRRQHRRAQCINARLTSRELERDCPISAADQDLLARAMAQFGLSARSYHRILRLARTIADLADAPDIATAHLTEALSYRNLDRRNYRG